MINKIIKKSMVEKNEAAEKVAQKNSEFGNFF